ncbi:MAG: hypothetical protein ACP5RR_02985 [Candidatus Kapaibacteriota bacterium]
MKELDIKDLLRKADELRALFVLGQRVIPFLEELFTFVGEIQPLLEDINNSIKENLSKMPSLSKQLSKVTEATELATNEILDIIDGIFYKLDILVTNIDLIQNRFSVVGKFVNDFAYLLEKRKDEIVTLEEFAEKVEKLFESFKIEYNKELNLSTLRDIVEKIRTDSTSIMLALQVQDITSQQIAAVNHLLTTVQSRLNALIHKFESSGVEKVVSETAETVNVTKLHREVAFDPDAVEVLVGNTTKQEDIDKMFEQGLPPESDSKSQPQTTEQNLDPNSSEQDFDNEPISQSDIDAMFNQNIPNPK